MKNRVVKEISAIETILPEINGDRCVHALIETASCQSCVDVCPQNSWILDDELLGLNTSTCDGCGLCVPACTEGAITQTKSCTIREEGQKKVLLLSCDYIDQSSEFTLKSNSWRCVHAVSANELLNFHHDGIYQIVASKGNCGNCSRGGVEHLYERVTKINKMLHHNNRPPLFYNELPVGQWHSLWKTPEKAAPGPDMSRRKFFRSAVKQTVDMVLHHSTLDLNQSKFIPLAKIVEGIEGEEAFYPAVPIISSERCNGCDTCIRACPHGALLFKVENGQARYEIDASVCSACHICTDICEQDAISISDWSRQVRSNHIISLDIKKCDSCGTIFHYPRMNQEEENVNALTRHLCNICEQVNHQKNLFQVFD